MADKTTIPVESDVRDLVRAQKVGGETYSDTLERLVAKEDLSDTAAEVGQELELIEEALFDAESLDAQEVEDIRERVTEARSELLGAVIEATCEEVASDVR